jgi:thiol-disulfide isomerase/thioredoxin
LTGFPGARSRKRVAALALAAAITGWLLQLEPAAAGPGVDASLARGVLADHVLRTLGGDSIRLGQLRGEVVVVHFWASWCPPCRRELPGLDALHAELAKQGGRVVAVSIDAEARNAQRFAKSLGLTLPIAHDGPDGLARKLDLGHIPFTMILDRSGAVVFTTAGTGGRAWQELCAEARRLAGAKPYASRPHEGEAR